jgi:hypothetical protein
MPPRSRDLRCSSWGYWFMVILPYKLSCMLLPSQVSQPNFLEWCDPVDVWKKDYFVGSISKSMWLGVPFHHSLPCISIWTWEEGTGPLRQYIKLSFLDFERFNFSSPKINSYKFCHCIIICRELMGRIGVWYWCHKQVDIYHTSQVPHSQTACCAIFLSVEPCH